MPQFDFRQFLEEQFHTPAALQALVIAYGFTAPKLSTIQKWWSRGSVPADAFPILLMLAELEAGTLVELMRYIPRSKTNDSAQAVQMD
jgi:hypothetical protein